jgi:hypothetical protein
LCKFIKPAQALTYAPKQTQFFKLASIRRCADHEGGIVVKAAICTDYMQVENEAPRSRAARYQRGLKTILYWKGTRRFPFQTNPFLVFHPAAELRGILLIKILKITKALHGDCSTGFGIVIGYGLSQIKIQHFPGATAQFCEQLTVKHEIDPQSFWNAENPLPVRHIFEHFCA